MTSPSATPSVTLHEAAAPLMNAWGPYRLTRDEIKRCLELGVDRMLTLLHQQKETSR